MALRLVFMGTPDFAVPTLLEVVAAGHDVAAVYTRAAKAAGRGMEVQPSPVEREASRCGLTVLTPRTLRTPEAAADFRAHRAMAAVVVAYGLILPVPILEAVPLGSLNVHASLLPRWRGAAPINRAIMAGDPVTGVSVMRMEEGLDTGPVALAEPVPIGADTTAGELHDTLARLGADLMVRALAALERGTLSFTPQPDSGITIAAKLDKRETRIDWARAWQAVHDHCRGLSPFPGAWFTVATERGPVRIKALLSMFEEGEGAPGVTLDNRLLVACGAGAVRLLRVQREGRAAQDADDLLRGFPIPAGAALG